MSIDMTVNLLLKQLADSKQECARMYNKRLELQQENRELQAKCGNMLASKIVAEADRDYERTRREKLEAKLKTASHELVDAVDKFWAENARWLDAERRVKELQRELAKKFWSENARWLGRRVELQRELDKTKKNALWLERRVELSNAREQNLRQELLNVLEKES